MKSLLAVLAIVGLASFASAATITFNFNDLANAANSTTISNTLTADLNSALSCVNCATVTVGAGTVADKNTYTADGHIEGGNTGSPAQITLGNSEGCTINGPGCTVDTSPSTDTYLRNIGTSSSTDTTNDRITITFTGISVYGVSFDYEIFPDGTATQPPDLIFQAANSKGTVLYTGTKLGVTPGTNGTWSRSSSGAETNAQSLGTWSQNFSGPVTSLSFIDWPATIGIDNLKIQTTPEPASVVLLGTLAGFFLLKLNRKRRKA